jgi:protein-tyrosine-phosphatase
VSAAGEAPGSVLFACTMNVVRSPMAAAILTHLLGRRIEVRSAGVRAGELDPYAVAVMDEIGIDISDHEPRTLRDIGDEIYDLIITLSPEAQHHAVELTRIMAAEVEYWPTEDATVYGDWESREELLAHYRHVRDQLFQRIKTRFLPEGGGGVTV